MNIEKLKNSLEVFNDENITFVKKIHKRNEFLFSIGESKFLPKELVWENEEYALFAEGVEEKIKIKIQDIIKKTEV